MNPEETGGCELHKNRPITATVPSNPSSPSSSAVHVKTNSTSTYPTKSSSTDTCDTNFGSSGSSSRLLQDHGSTAGSGQTLLENKGKCC